MKKSVFTLGICLCAVFLISCSKNEDAEIRKTVTDFFSNKVHYGAVDRQLISPDLALLIDKAISREKDDAEKVAKSDHPGDKPLMIEGDIFTSLYEGQDTFQIDTIKVKGDSAFVVVQFANTGYKESWKDEVVLIKKETWRIDNVYFGEEKDLKSTKDVLKQLINTPD
ncbi:hypothetical protein HMPREF0765_0662 [Sphingobacterium spiritivorum ATCC 33300]|uniref:DUF3828 domain-containing protein n=1 Tax=Sphingobacterium spiritivorum ATCC 33300 TaxID=525372 RepID=C2FTK6_SPHSI|nr:hypothetical protein [Sphingobacterium spiritivorum]EEI93809.1 hypothetical protein HMPREF0765_0662 [Sphingobacterium spiritivorum ATCC 33300]QQS93981.1 hypothetical protein I6J03_11170 [Sphingobacterium spiritivorum]